MNNLIFLDHVLLIMTDANTCMGTKYQDYFNLYRRWEIPPGIEFLVSRSAPMALSNPWNITTSSFPLPEAKQVSFVDAADSFGQSIANEMDNGKQVFMLWSGGIDSTCGVVSVLKNCKPEHAKQIHIVMSDLSRQENPMFYEKYLKQYDRIEYATLNFSNYDLKNSLILDGEGGDQMFGSSMSNRLFSIAPDKINLPWRSHLDLISKMLRKPWDTDNTWDIFMNFITGSIPDSVRVETLAELFWWINFNCKLDAVLLRTPLYYGHNLNDTDFAHLMTNCTRRLFAHTEVQQWSMSAASSEKIEGGKLTKLPARRYIYDFDHNEYYFREKRKELSTPMFNRKYFAMDKDYNRYSLDDRAVRQQVRQLVYPDAVGKISFEEYKITQVYDTSLKFWKANPVDK